MKQPYYKARKAARQMTGSIAFYPTFFALASVGLAILIMWLEYRPFIIDLKQPIGYLLVKSREDARLILGTLVGSLFSLMVFSFSMVMLVLNRASTNLTPRVIPGLITHQPNQIVLGVYLGSIVYCLLLIVNIQSDEQDYMVPSLGVLIAMLSGILSLTMFMYFIHAISQTIQVENILERTRRSTVKRIRKMSTNGRPADVSMDKLPRFAVTNRYTGYLKKVDEERLAKLCSKNDLKVELKEPIGSFLTEGSPYLQVAGRVSADLKDEIDSCFLFYPEERLDDHYIFGFKHISEIGVKALSPGVNDPGTARKALDMLLDLFREKMSLPDERPVIRDDGEAALVFPRVTLNQLLWDNVAPIREYGKSDVTVVLHLLKTLQALLPGSTDESLHGCVAHIVSTVDGARNSLHNPADRRAVNAQVRRINLALTGHIQLEELLEAAPASPPPLNA